MAFFTSSPRLTASRGNSEAGREIKGRERASEACDRRRTSSGAPRRPRSAAPGIPDMYIRMQQRKGKEGLHGIGKVVSNGREELLDGRVFLGEGSESEAEKLTFGLVRRLHSTFSPDVSLVSQAQQWGALMDQSRECDGRAGGGSWCRRARGGPWARMPGGGRGCGRPRRGSPH